MMKDLNSPITRWKWMKIAECRKEFLQIRSEDQAVSENLSASFAREEAGRLFTMSRRILVDVCLFLVFS